jgi:hypothetical protein
VPLSDSEKLRILGAVAAALQQARKSRYPVVLTLAQGEQTQPELWRGIAQTNGLGFLDMLEQVQTPGFRRIADVWPVLVDWVREQTIGVGGVVVVELDALATRWDDDGRERFFLKLLKSETRQSDTHEAAPVVVVSQLAGQYGLPREPRESGLVLDLNE